MEQPTTGKGSFEDETEFALQMIRKYQSEIKSELQILNSYQSSIRQQVGFIYGAVILILLLVFALVIIIAF